VEDKKGKTENSDFGHIGHPQKQALLRALRQTLGIVSPACEAVGMPRSTHYHWLKTDPVYREAVENVMEIQIDFVESALMKQIRDGNIAGCIFYLKCKAKNRGYVERTEIKQIGDIDPMTDIPDDEVEKIARSVLNGEGGKDSSADPDKASDTQKSE